MFTLIIKVRQTSPYRLRFSAKKKKDYRRVRAMLPPPTFKRGKNESYEYVFPLFYLPSSSSVLWVLELCRYHRYNNGGQNRLAATSSLWLLRRRLLLLFFSFCCCCFFCCCCCCFLLLLFFFCFFFLFFRKFNISVAMATNQNQRVGQNSYGL